MYGVKGRVLVVDDDVALSEMLGIVLRTEGFEPVFCGDGARALAVFRETRPDLVLLDLMLPGRDGIDVCRSIRAESGVPIVMLTAKTDTIDVVLGLESGADDYVVKPFKPKELVARVRTRLRRNDEPAEENLRIGDLEIDVAGHVVRRDEEQIFLTPLEFDLLVALEQVRHQFRSAGAEIVRLSHGFAIVVGIVPRGIGDPGHEGVIRNREMPLGLAG